MMRAAKYSMIDWQKFKPAKLFSDFTRGIKVSSIDSSEFSAVCIFDTQQAGILIRSEFSAAGLSSQREWGWGGSG